MASNCPPFSKPSAYPGSDQDTRAPGPIVYVVLDQIGDALDSLGDDGENPAERFARSIRLAARYARARPEPAKIMVCHGLEHLDSDRGAAWRGVAFRARRDIEDGIAARKAHTLASRELPDLSVRTR